MSSVQEVVSEALPGCGRVQASSEEVLVFAPDDRHGHWNLTLEQLVKFAERFGVPPSKVVLSVEGRLGAPSGGHVPVMLVVRR